MAIIKAGRVNTNLTRKAAFLTVEKALAICGNAGEIVMTDMIVKLLTSKSVSFKPGVLFSMELTFSFVVMAVGFRRLTVCYLSKVGLLTRTFII